MSRAAAVRKPPPRSRAAPRRGPDPVEDELYRLIAEAILHKQLRPGGRIREAALAEQFGVSRARVRRVLQRLAEFDMVEFRLNYGALIRRPTAEEARAVFATRRLIEGETVREATRCATPADIARLRKFVDGEARAFRRNDKGLAGLSSGFHLLLGELCGNAVLARILTQLVHRCVLIQALYERQNQNTICLTHEHADIIEMMARGRGEEAVQAMLHHLDHIEASLDYGRETLIDRRLGEALG